MEASAAEVVVADAMKKVVEAYPDDLDAAALYAEALFLLEPRGGRRDLANPNVERIVGVLERALAKDLHHPGACHLYIHITEATSDFATKARMAFPPALPIAPAKRPSVVSMITGVIDERGFFPPATALAAGPPSFRFGSKEKSVS